jgi:hypothetical protein
VTINIKKKEKRERRVFVKVFAPLEYKNLKRAVSFEEHAHWQGQEAHGGLTYTTVV